MKLYSNSQVVANTPKCQTAFDKLNEIKEYMRETLKEEDFPDACIRFHNAVREKLNLPNKVFCFAKKAGTKETVICLFDIAPKPDKLYDVFIDGTGVYINIGE